MVNVLLVFREFTFGSDVLHQQLACLWMGDYLLTIELSGYINYLDRDNPSKPKKILKVLKGILPGRNVFSLELRL